MPLNGRLLSSFIVHEIKLGGMTIEVHRCVRPGVQWDEINRRGQNRTWRAFETRVVKSEVAAQNQVGKEQFSFSFDPVNNSNNELTFHYLLLNTRYIHNTLPCIS